MYQVGEHVDLDLSCDSERETNKKDIATRMVPYQSRLPVDREGAKECAEGCKVMLCRTSFMLENERVTVNKRLRLSRIFIRVLYDPADRFSRSQDAMKLSMVAPAVPPASQHTLIFRDRHSPVPSRVPM